MTCGGAIRCVRVCVCVGGRTSCSQSLRLAPPPFPSPLQRHGSAKSWSPRAPAGTGRAQPASPTGGRHRAAPAAARPRQCTMESAAQSAGAGPSYGWSPPVRGGGSGQNSARVLGEVCILSCHRWPQGPLLWRVEGAGEVRPADLGVDAAAEIGLGGEQHVQLLYGQLQPGGSATSVAISRNRRVRESLLRALLQTNDRDFYGLEQKLRYMCRRRCLSVRQAGTPHRM